MVWFEWCLIGVFLNNYPKLQKLWIVNSNRQLKKLSTTLIFKESMRKNFSIFGFEMMFTAIK